MTDPGWESALPTPPEGARLHEAWMTTFEQPDSGLLVEHLLPALLGGSYALSKEFKDRQLFFAELGSTLEALHGRVTVISTAAPGPRPPAPYPWLGRYVSHFIVGAKGRAVQHSKLWAFHWRNDEGAEQLELRVSSTNLTQSAFKGQLQAGWRCLLPLAERGTQKAQRSWKELVLFIEALGVSAGPEASSRLDRLLNLLSRAECPADVAFVASTPGRKSCARQLAQYDPAEIHVIAPTIGEWNHRTIAAWSEDLGIAADKVHLKWISVAHPWAQPGQWTLSHQAREALDHAGVRLEILETGFRLSDDHLPGDERWSHAKLYLFRCRNTRRRRLLVTSANWSSSAWGAGRTPARNFELGVTFETDWTALEHERERFTSLTRPYCIEHGADEEVEPEVVPPLEWASASWNGARLELKAQSTNDEIPITVDVTFDGAPLLREVLSDGETSIPWSSAAQPPLTASFTQGKDVLEVDVVDLRPPSEVSQTPLPEVDEKLQQELRDLFLLQRYGRHATDPETIPGLMGDTLVSSTAGPAVDYAVQAWIDGRAAFDVVDSWQAALDKAAGDESELQRVMEDGRALRDIFARRGRPADALVVEEFGWRMDGGA